MIAFYDTHPAASLAEYGQTASWKCTLVFTKRMFFVLFFSLANIQYTWI